METRYFVIPAEKTIKFKAKLIPTKAFSVSRLDSKYVKKIDKELTAITKEAEHKRAKEAKEEPKAIEPIVLEELIPEFDLQSRIIGTLADGRKIVNCIVPGHLRKGLDNLTEEEEKFSPAWLTDCGIKDQYIGMTRGDVLKKFPELLGKLELQN